MPGIFGDNVQTNSVDGNSTSEVASCSAWAVQRGRIDIGSDPIGSSRFEWIRLGIWILGVAETRKQVHSVVTGCVPVKLGRSLSDSSPQRLVQVVCTLSGCTGTDDDKSSSAVAHGMRGSKRMSSIGYEK